MRKRSPLLAVLALLASTAGMVLATSPARAADPQDLVFPVFGYQAYHHFAAADFALPFGHGQMPAGVDFVDHLTCATTADGTPINNDLPGGRYKVDPATCSGITLTGPNAASYQVKYTVGGDYYVYPGQIDLPQDVTATGIVTSLLKLRTTYSGRLRDYYTKEPIAGLQVTVTSQLSLLPILNGPSCTAVTDAAGRYSCSTLPISWGLLGQPYRVETKETANYAAIAPDFNQPNT